MWTTELVLIFLHFEQKHQTQDNILHSNVIIQSLTKNPREQICNNKHSHYEKYSMC